MELDKPGVFSGFTDTADISRYSDFSLAIHNLYFFTLKKNEFLILLLISSGFWMAFGDFLKYFQDLDICHISHDVDQDITFHGRWEDGLNAGGVQKADWKNFAKNPQCFIRLSDPDPIDPQGRSSAVVSLMQRRQPNSTAKGMNKV